MGTKLSTKDVIKYSAYEVLNNGYTKRSDESDCRCTADNVLDAITMDEVSDDELCSIKDYIDQWSIYVLDSNSQKGEYFDNLRSEITKPLIDESKIGLIASSFASFNKYRSFSKINELDKSSNFIGEEGDRIVFNITEHKLVKTGASKFGNGKWFLYKIYDDNHNVIIYFSDHNLDEEFEKYNKASAIVSKLSTFNEVKQTNITKMKFMK